MRATLRDEVTRRNARRASALGVLRTLPRLVAAVLLPLDLAWIARDEAGFLERAAQLRVGLEQRPRDAVSDRDRLGRDAATLHARVDPEAVECRRDLERLMHDHARRLAAEVRVERALVDDDLALAGLETDARDRRLPLAGRPDDGGAFGAHLPFSFNARGAGRASAPDADDPARRRS